MLTTLSKGLATCSGQLSTPAAWERTLRLGGFWQFKRPTRVVPWIVGGAGVASLAASGVFFLLHGRETRKLERDCIDGICPTSSESTIDRANLYGTAGWVGLAAGAVGVGAAVVLLSTRGGEAPAASRRPRLEIGAGATRGGGAAFARARF